MVLSTVMCAATSSSSSTRSPGPSPSRPWPAIEKVSSADFRLGGGRDQQRHASELGAQAVADGVDLGDRLLGRRHDQRGRELARRDRDGARGRLGGATNILVRALDLPLDPVEVTGVLIAKALDDASFRLHLVEPTAATSP